MANIKSQIKRIKVSEKERMRNKTVRSSMKTHISKFKSALAGNMVEAESALKEALKAIDNATSKGVIHSNNAANKKSAIMREFNKIKVQASAAVTKETKTKVAKTAKTTAAKKTVTKKPVVKKTTAKKTTANKTAAKKASE